MQLKLIILMGLPGSGKSTFSSLLYPKYQVVNQDTLGNRRDCMNVMKINLQRGKSVIIDRTNISKKQRNYFLDAAKEFNTENYCIFFDIPAQDCIERIKNRKNHRTLSGEKTSEEKIIEVVVDFNKELQLPEYNEGFKDVHIINNDAEFTNISSLF